MINCGYLYDSHFNEKRSICKNELKCMLQSFVVFATTHDAFSIFPVKAIINGEETGLNHRIIFLIIEKLRNVLSLMPQRCNCERKWTFIAFLTHLNSELLDRKYFLTLIESLDDDIILIRFLKVLRT